MRLPTATVAAESATLASSKLLDGGILAVIFLAPLFMGGRGPIGKFVFVSIVFLTVIAWAIGQCRQPRADWRRSGVEWLLLAGIGLVVLQLVPLPPALLARISPAVGELLPLWTVGASGTSRLDTWATVSLTPEATRGALVVLVGYVVLFLLVVQRIGSIEDVKRILRWVAIGTIAMAVLGLTQFLLGNGKFLWVFDHPSRDTYRVVKGAFHNQNHFAHFLALGIGPLIWTWAGSHSKSLSKHVFGIGLGVVLVAGLLTFSRGGIIAIAVAGGATVVIYYWKSLLDKRSLAIAGVMGLVVIAALVIHGYEPLSARFLALQESRSLQEVSDGRAALWAALLEGIPHFAWLGSGIGSHRDVYPLFLDKHYEVEFTHGENGYLPLTLEGGIAAILLMLTGICICFWWCFRVLTQTVPAAEEASARRSRRRSTATSVSPGQQNALGLAACTGAIVAALLASVVHSFGDFVWYLSSCMSITVVLAACLCRLHQISQLQGSEHQGEAPAARYRSGFSQPAWIGVTAVLVIAGTFLIHDRHRSAFAAPHWYDYKRVALPTYGGAMPEEATERELLLKMSNSLEEALRHDPNDPRTNLRYAAACLRRFELEQRHATNPMALQQIREAALASQFASKEAQNAWLDVAVGENKKLLDLALLHCHRALRNGPLQGDGYIYLADLSFLEGPNAEAKDAYVAQANLVRPHSGVVAFAVGQERALAGDLEGTLAAWREAFHQDPQIRGLIIEQFAAKVPGAFFLEHFQPDTAALHHLQRTYQRTGQITEAQVVAKDLATKLVIQAKAEPPQVAAQTWFEAHRAFEFLQDVPSALQCVHQAVALDGDNATFRAALGALLLEQRDYVAAERELQWCLRRKPDDPDLLRQLTEAKRGTVQQRAAASPTSVPATRQF